MPSFVCDRCQSTLKKNQLDQHVGRCRGASFSCIDCYKSFANRQDYVAHTSCITEVQKYHDKKQRDALVGANIPAGTSNQPVSSNGVEQKAKDVSSEIQDQKKAKEQKKPQSQNLEKEHEKNDIKDLKKKGRDKRKGNREKKDRHH